MSTIKAACRSILPIILQNGIKQKYSINCVNLFHMVEIDTEYSWKCRRCCYLTLLNSLRQGRTFTSNLVIQCSFANVDVARRNSSGYVIKSFTWIPICLFTPGLVIWHLNLLVIFTCEFEFNHVNQSIPSVLEVV